MRSTLLTFAGGAKKECRQSGLAYAFRANSIGDFMLFSSITFLYYFLPCVLILYNIVPEKWKNGALLLASLVFYAWGEPKFVFLMIAMVLFGYFTGLLVERCKRTPKGKFVFWGTLTVNVAVLCFFKFSDAAWPIGISFYTFQLISYLADVYRGTVGAQKNPVNLAAYVTMFPQLIAGPIVRYEDIEAQLRKRSHHTETILYGIQRFLLGLGKKILIADALGELCGIFKASGEKSVVFFWVYALSFTLQIYFDFSGYSDMAIGLGKIFGFDFPENFNYPYISGSITEFWRRWHISLGTWFRDYVYIPMGGNRVSRARWFFNIFVVWFLTGLWHGAAPNFVLWGLMFGALLVVEKMWLLKKLEKSRVFKHFYVLFFVIFGFVLFQAENPEDAIFCIKGMLGMGGVPFMSAECAYYLRSYGILMVAAILGSTPIVKRLAVRAASARIGEKLMPWVRPFLLLLLLAVCTAYLVDSSFSPFLYFRF